MFFIGILGIEDRRKTVKVIQNSVCKACNRLSSYELIKENTVFHLFFIPIFKWNKRYYLVSRCCNSIFQIPIEIGEEIENSKRQTIQDDDLEDVHINSSEVCINCGLNIEKSFQYCPRCGSRLK
ncbi:zinc ribbon domain-containing protein [Clostridium rectalis]|uniref:zinc ribbon domain-containing protein n=1 Tax=Clostridium rectalis TaxID=2040295 RepID=UPI000F633B87|nr:zinc ribbon domain-containing protein [Clostridium rectalis]